MTLTRRAFSQGVGTAAASIAAPSLLRAAEPLTIGWVLANSMHWAQCVAIEKGIYKEVGFEPQAVNIQNSPASVQMAIAGGYQVATSQPDPFIYAVERGASNLAALSAPMNSPDWVLNGSAAVKTLQDLKGKTIGISSLRTPEAWLTTQLLLKNGFNRGEFDFIQAGLSTAKITALQKGALGAAVLYQPTAEFAVRQGFVALAHYGTLRSYPTILYVVNKDWAAKGDAGKRVAQTIQRAHAWLWNADNKAEAIDIIAKYTKRETTILDSIYNEYFVTDKIYGRAGAIELDGLARALTDMAEDGNVFKVAPPPTKYVLDPELGGLLA